MIKLLKGTSIVRNTRIEQNRISKPKYILVFSTSINMEYVSEKREKKNENSKK